MAGPAFVLVEQPQRPDVLERAADAAVSMLTCGLPVAVQLEFRLGTLSAWTSNCRSGFAGSPKSEPPPGSPLGLRNSTSTTWARSGLLFLSVAVTDNVVVAATFHVTVKFCGTCWR